jgi:hypothetical protein
MDFNELMDENKKEFNTWLENKELMEYWEGNKIGVQKEFIACIQQEIGSKFILLTNEELRKEKERYHASMDGFDY